MSTHTRPATVVSPPPRRNGGAARASQHFDDKALVTLILALGQFCFFMPLALIGKPFPGMSPAEQWRK